MCLESYLSDSCRVSLVVEMFVRMLHDCGMPLDDVDLIHGNGKVVGEILNKAGVRSTLFTGSGKVAELLAQQLKGKVQTIHPKTNHPKTIHQFVTILLVFLAALERLLLALSCSTSCCWHIPGPAQWGIILLAAATVRPDVPFSPSDLLQQYGWFQFLLLTTLARQQRCRHR